MRTQWRLTTIAVILIEGQWWVLTNEDKNPSSVYSRIHLVTTLQRSIAHPERAALRASANAPTWYA